MASEVINFAQKLSAFSEHWSPRVVAEMNDYQFKLVKLEGEFVWHDHKDTDEVFLVLKGEMEIGFRDRTVTVRAAARLLHRTMFGYSVPYSAFAPVSRTTLAHFTSSLFT